MWQVSSERLNSITPDRLIRMADRDQEFVAMIIKEIVNHPDDVVVVRTVDELGVLLSVKVHKEDMGLLIGRSGSTAKAIRTLARIVGMRNNARVNLRIEEPEGGRMSGGNLGDGQEKTVEDVVEGIM